MEYYAGQAAQQCGILPSVSYDLSNDSGAICSLCPLFTSKDVAYLSMDHYMAIHGITDSGKYMDVLQELGLLDQYLNMVLFDCIICNSDRHLGNFGVLAETRDYTPISLSPIFDNGMSLGVFWMPDNDKDIIRFALESGPSLLNRGNFLEVGRKLLTDANKTCVENLREWQIQPHPQYNWGDEKVHAMNELLRYQVENILGRHSGA